VKIIFRFFLKISFLPEFTNDFSYYMTKIKTHVYVAEIALVTRTKCASVFNSFFPSSMAIFYLRPQVYVALNEISNVFHHCNSLYYKWLFLVFINNDLLLTFAFR